MEHASADPATWEKTARWYTVLTTVARRASARRASASARMALLEMTVTLVSYTFLFFTALLSFSAKKKYFDLCHSITLNRNSEKVKVFLSYTCCASH